MDKMILTDCDGVILNFETIVAEYLNQYDDNRYDYEENDSRRWLKEVIHPEAYDLGVRFGLYDEGKTKEEVKTIIHQLTSSPANDYLMSGVPPYLDSVKYLSKLKNLGYDFWALTAIGTANETINNRCYNLHRHFKEFFFKDPKKLPVEPDNYKITFMEPSAYGTPNKRAVLEEFAEKYPNAIWVEDRDDNADIGHELGFQTFLMKHDYNKSYNGPCTMVNNWKEIYEIVSKQ